nr:PCRF domain-containing protein [Clostridia bacterium]
MYDKLDFIQEKYEELSLKVSDPEIINDQSVWQKSMKDMSDMEPIVNKYREYKKATDELKSTKEMLNDNTMDEDFREMAKLELSELEERQESLSKELQVLLLPKDPNDDKNVILEVRAGTGGDEAGLFGSDLLRMYMRYAERRGWKVEMMDVNDTGIGGIKEAVILIKGRGAYSRLKYESGVHRVQRVPETESSGRIHTSAATVAVLPEID